MYTVDTLMYYKQFKRKELKKPFTNISTPSTRSIPVENSKRGRKIFHKISINFHKYNTIDQRNRSPLRLYVTHRGRLVENGSKSWEKWKGKQKVNTEWSNFSVV